MLLPEGPGQSATSHGPDNLMFAHSDKGLAGTAPAVIPYECDSKRASIQSSGIISSQLRKITLKFQANPVY
jgi:hypothetical protein